MTVAVHSSAPGKVVLCGEYAVLDGAPAICLAIDRRARVRITDNGGALNRILAPGYSDIEGQFRSTATGVEWLQGKQQYALVDAVWRAAGIGPPAGRKIAIDTREFLHGASGRKIGIGASAAVAVALAAAFTERRDVADIARQAHAELQAGAGSGVDIACSHNGGLIEYSMDDVRTTQLNWPSGLLFRLLWTGVAASTMAKIARLENAMVRPSRARLSEAASTMADIWRGADAQAVIAQYRHYIEALRQFSLDHALGIFDAGHNDLYEAARALNLIYKPCGAGGGDIGVVFGTDAAKLQAFVGRQSAKYVSLDCEIDHRGVALATSKPDKQ